jgi:hypothetical protein
MTAALFVGAITCLTCLPVYSALLSVGATATLPAGSTALVTDFESITKTFSLVVTGGTGSGFATADLSPSGTTNENGPLFVFLNGVASTTWPTFMGRGNLEGDAGNVSPSFDCGTNDPNCTVPFTLGVPQVFSMTLTASVKIQANPLAPTIYDTTAHTNAEFDGLLAFRTCPYESCEPFSLLSVDYSLSEITVPESSPAALVGFSLLLLALATGAIGKAAGCSSRRAIREST